VGEVRSLPREVVVMEEGPTLAQHVIEHVARVEVEGERGEVLDDDEVRVGQGRVQHRDLGRGRRVDRQSRNQDVGDALAGDGSNAVAERLERALPLGRLDGDAVGPPESETDDDDPGHGSRLGTVSGRIYDQ
jgi:hypothetical protein